MRLYLLPHAFFVLAFSGAAHAVTGQILPAEPIAEPTEHGLAFNFDILVRNDEPAALTLETIHVEYLDGNGELISSRDLNGNGSAPNVLTVPNRGVAPDEERLVFNPYPLVSPRASVARVKVLIGFSNAGGNTRRTLELSADISTRKPALIDIPLAGRLLVWDGHDALSHHRRWDYALPFLRQLGFTSNGMRYSWDLVPVNDANQRHRQDPSRNEDWFGFGAVVRAADGGEVVKAVAHHADDGSFDPATSLADSNALFGNYIVVKHADGTFCIYAHLRQGSLTVKAGDRVKRGQPIAAIGRSGSAEFPHLHFQMMDGPDMHGEGVPAAFREFTRVLGAKTLRAKRGSVDSGDLLIAP